MAVASTTVIASDGYETPYFNEIEDVPSDWIAKLQNLNAAASWLGSNAHGAASVEWFGNRFSMTRTMEIDGDEKTPLTSSNWKIWPILWETYTPQTATYSTLQPCGQMATWTVTATSRVVAVLEVLGLTDLDEVEDSNADSKSQDACEPDVSPVPGGGGGGEEGPCGPEVIVCECWVEVAWFEWINGEFVQVSASWWENWCENGLGAMSTEERKVYFGRTAKSRLDGTRAR